MGKDHQEILLKRRSARGCIRDGLQFYFAHFRQILRQTWPITLGYALLSAVASAIPVLFSPTLLLWGTLIGVVAVILLLVASRWILHKKQILHASGKVTVLAWLRHLGAIILIAIVCLFVISILTLLTSLPSIIMMAANWQSQMGIINGDPVGMPDYVRWLSLGAFLIAGFFQAYVWLSILFPFHLLKASISSKEEEMKQLNNFR